MRSQRGFTVVEVSIVLGVIAVIAAVLVPELDGFFARSKQVEAKNKLALVLTLESAYAKKNGAYTRDLAALGFPLVGPARYEVLVPFAGAESFTALAQASSRDVIVKDCGARDTWQIDEQGHLLAVNNCASK